ncbi:MAG TPA: hypothetical protein ENH46_04500 [Candidatus Pacearchaeota archaeon]|nr:hypothetical protein [Candidatus Pacearchaeota archaeon]
MGGLTPSVIILLIWTIAWKGVALWKSARKNSILWFVALLVLNTAGILPILYIFVFSKMKKIKSKKSSKRKKR